jgi:hypothetical protein
MDPHKRSATIDIIDEREAVLARGRFGTDRDGYRAMLALGRRRSRSPVTSPGPREVGPADTGYVRTVHGVMMCRRLDPPHVAHVRQARVHVAEAIRLGGAGPADAPANSRDGVCDVLAPSDHVEQPGRSSNR